MSDPYMIPAQRVRTEIKIRRSRFVTTVDFASSVPLARDCIAGIRADMADASHHVYAFRVGYGNSVTEGMSDDGEPTGTSGPPTLAVVRGSGLGDIVLVTTRYFGGTKLGTGGLVRAYTESAQVALKELRTELKVEKSLVGLEMPYSLYNIVKRLIEAYSGEVDEEDFGAQVLVIVRFVTDDLSCFAAELRDRTAGRVTVVDL